MKFGLLRATSADGRTTEHPLDLPSLVIGRAEGNSIVLDDLSVARRHARLVIESGRLLIEDLGSASGTYVGGHRIPPNTPSLVENLDDIRLGDVRLVYQAPETLETPGQPGVRVAHTEPVAAEAPAPIRLTLSLPALAIEPGGAPLVGTLRVQNGQNVVDQLRLRVMGVPAEWVRLSSPELVLVPGDEAEVTVAIQPPKAYEARAGEHDISIGVTSSETGIEAIASGSIRIRRFEQTDLTLDPVRSKRNFALFAENQGNSFAQYTLTGEDEENAFKYEFSQPAVDLQPGERRELGVRVRRPRRLFGTRQGAPFRVIAVPEEGTEERVQVDGQLLIAPPLEPLRRPVMMLLPLSIIAAVVVLAVLVGVPGRGTKEANAEALYEGVHMCDKGGAKTAAKQQSPTPDPNKPAGGQPGFGGPNDGGPLFAQNDGRWGSHEYARAQDPEFGPDWCGSTIAQCGCAMTSVATVMAMFGLLTMPEGNGLSPDTLNSWFNLDAKKTARGWVSRGYIYGDVIWTAANQLSAEMAAKNPGAPTIRFLRTGNGSEEEIRGELDRGRPIILEVPGHWIAAVGIDASTNKILINDPFYRDRTTLDAYAGKVKSSVLFEPSSDLSAVVITAPADVRIRVTDKQGRVVGTLNTASPEEAERAARNGIPGASYSSRQAWRDPTCVESPPKPGDGTNQIVLPGSRDDYKIEVLDADGGESSIAIHTYDKNGNPWVEVLESDDGKQVAELGYDPEKTRPDLKVIEGASPTPEAELSPSPGSEPGGGTNGAARTATPTATPTPPEIGEETALSGEAEAGSTTVPITSQGGFQVGDYIRFSPGTPIEEDNQIVGFGSFVLAAPLKYSHGAGSKIVRIGRPPPAPPQQPTTAGLKPPEKVDVSCTITYQANPRRANLVCGATIAGQYTGTRWTANGSVVSQFTNGVTMLLTFETDTSVNVATTACNSTSCRSAVAVQEIRFPTTGTGSAGTTAGGSGTSGGTTTGGTPTPPAVGVLVRCNPQFQSSLIADINCTAYFTGNSTSVNWKAPGGSPATQGGNNREFTTTVTDGDPINVTATVCNFSVCYTSPPLVVTIPTTITTLTFENPNGEVAQGNKITMFASVIAPGSTTTPQGGTVTFRYGAFQLGAPQPLFSAGNFATASLTVDIGPGQAINAPSPPYPQTFAITAEYSGGINAFGSTSDPQNLSVLEPIVDGCNSKDDDVPPDGDVDEDCTYTVTNIGAGTILEGVSVNGGSNDVTVAPGAGITVSGGARRTDYCPGCIRQVYLAVGDNLLNSNPPIGPSCRLSGSLYWNDVVAVPISPWTFNAPTRPGVYYLRGSSSLQYGCVAMPVPGPASSVGRITVIGTPSVTMTANPAGPIALGQTTTITVNVSVPGSSVPYEANVNVTNASNVIVASGALNNGQFSFTTSSALAVGSYTYTASFQPTGVYADYYTSASGAVTFVVENPGPVLSSISPTTKLVGDNGFTLTAVGTGFLPVSKLYWGATELTTVYDSSTQLHATVPTSAFPSPGTYTVTVQNPSPGGGTSTGRTVTVDNPLPVMGSLGTTTAIAGGAGFNLTVNGTAFVPTSEVRWNGVARATTYVSPTEVQAAISAGDIATAGTASVTVFNPAPGGGTSDSRTFTIENPVPTITTLTPSTAPAGTTGVTLTIDGTNFVTTSEVLWEGAAMAGVVYVSSTQLTVPIPDANIANNGNYAVRVRNPAPGGGTSAAENFTVSKAATTISLAMNQVSPITYGTSVTFTATVSGTPPGNIGGSVDFTAASTPTSGVPVVVATASVVNNGGVYQATWTTSTLTAWNYSITAKYTGQGKFDPSPDSTAVLLTVQNAAPTTSSISPTHVTAGTANMTLTVNGTGFVPTANGSKVWWDDGVNPAVELTTNYQSATVLLATVPSSVLEFGKTASITVVNPTPGGGTSNAQTFTVNNPTPSTSGLSASVGLVGDTNTVISVNGGGFTSTSVVRWDGVDQTTTFVNVNQVSFTVTAAMMATTGSHSITVFNPTPGGGTSGSQAFNVNNPAPSVTTLGTTTATAGDAAFTLTVNGSSFVSGSKVHWNGSERTTIFLNSGQLEADITAADIATGGTATVTVVSPAPGGGTSGGLTFYILYPTPTITSLSPDNTTAGSAGFTLTVNGTGFVSGSSVVIWDGDVLVTTFVNSTQLTAAVNMSDVATAATRSVTVRTSQPNTSTSTSNAATFTINNPVPSITSLSPNTRAANASSFTLTITGTGFVSGATVSFGAAGPLTPTSITSTQIVVDIPNGAATPAASYNVIVTNPTPGGGASPAAVFTVT